MIALKIKAALALLACAAVLTGCGVLKKRQPAPELSATPAAAAQPAAPPTATPAPPVPALTEVAVADDAIAASEDFEDEAFQKVSDKTYKAELQALKKEIEAK